MNISFCRNGKLSFNVKQLKSFSLNDGVVTLIWENDKEEDIPLNEISRLYIYEETKR